SIVMCSNTTTDVTALYSTAGFATTWTLQGVTVPDPAAIADGGLYRVVVSSGANCSDTAWVNVDEQPAPAIGDDATATICPGATADLTASLALAGCTTQWSLAGAPVPDATALSTPGVYTVIATATNGCSDVADVSLIVAAEPVLGADQSITACDNTTTDLTALFNTNGCTTSWTLNGAAVPAPTATNTAGTYALSATNASGCSSTVSVQLQTIAAPVLAADQTLNTCADAPVDLTALYTTNGLTSLWTLNGSPVVDATAANATGLYRLVVSSTSGCSDTALVDLLVSPVPDLGADLSLERCPWQTVDLSALFPVAGLTVSYTLNGVPVLDPTAVADTGTFVVTVGDDIGCSDEAQVHVSEQYCACMADFGTDLHCLQEPARFEVLADSVLLSAYWDFHGAATNSHLVDPSVRFATDAPVRVTLDATLTCGTVRVERIFEPVDCSAQCSLWVPAAFTPDDDGLNDAWRWSSACAVSDFSVVVFDRWGERVFASTDPSELWDGTFQGATIPTGVYAYRMSYRLPYQERTDVSGSVTLVR
ncbi:MAG: gliding motility-associated C-terminal domain-containing protein, partial [Flavobacteriales bacterium]|nr:gliding motility-associated C-terminal domain-containing protein [Flavobacteriales bacterium]